MKDVIMLCDRNYERRRWEDELLDAELQSVMQRKKQMREAERREKRLEAIKTARIACAMACGAAATILAIGIANWHPASLICGGIALLAFGASGAILEDMEERA